MCDHSEVEPWRQLAGVRRRENGRESAVLREEARQHPYQQVSGARQLQRWWRIVVVVVVVADEQQERAVRDWGVVRAESVRGVRREEEARGGDKEERGRRRSGVRLRRVSPDSAARNGDGRCHGSCHSPRPDVRIFRAPFLIKFNFSFIQFIIFFFFSFCINRKVYIYIHIYTALDQLFSTGGKWQKHR